ncbi:MAG: 50S ribosomal protein L24 [Candidatus Pacebacteria bacterium]|jgi:large subunit ribosomal protein L24|nr:50S ribosomal protein L24 [Candidatus Paceibacterota bacterium]MBT4652380.1 50S ribosomal protein L24 [Candidatus Paceibacterota bacterium]MBT6756207.1 50S ribosomal protein L24 [Candidatus Paceibacterota bacterium]MBT6921498.1 50S ribosomal protein L24 [Candidatus Paceibacterota bacterium]
MKLITGDKVLVTGGKDKGKKGEIVKVFPKKHRVLVKDVNIYAKHVKPQAGRPGEIVRRERPLPTANVAILNDKGEVDRVGYKVTKDGKKERIFKKTGTVISLKKTKKVAPKKTTKKK